MARTQPKRRSAALFRYMRWRLGVLWVLPITQSALAFGVVAGSYKDSCETRTSDRSCNHQSTPKLPLAAAAHVRFIR